jgi:hypothetical protein
MDGAQEFVSSKIGMKELASYLNDHLAGSTAAVELLDHLKESHRDGELGKLFKELHAEVSSDQEVLRKLLRRFSREGGLRKAGAWIAEKFNRVKLRLAGDKAGELGLVEALEILVLGITGKQLLWRALSASLGDSPLLRGIDLSQLEQRAIDQSERVEAHRLEAAREAFLKV